MPINTMLALQLNIFMVMLLSSIAGHAYFKLDRSEQAHRLFFRLILLTLFILVLEILSVALNSREYADYIIVHRLVDTLGFALSPLVPFCTVLYVGRKTRQYKKISAKIFWLAVPLALNGIVSVGSYHFNWIFSISADNIYGRGPLFLVSPLTFYLYYATNLAVLYGGRKMSGKEELLILGTLTVIPAAMSVFQLYYFIYLTIWNSMAIAVIINYVFLIHSQAKIDPLTGLGNRIAYNEYIAGLAGKSDLVLAAVTIDLDDFKSINDIHGHHEGDKVLRLFAGQLADTFEGRGIPIRVGGDEFVILISENDEAIVEQYVARLQDRINDHNARSGAPYPIRFSYGIAIYGEPYNSIDELICHSDKLMYQTKRRKTDGPS